MPTGAAERPPNPRRRPSRDPHGTLGRPCPPDLADTAELLASELLSNAMKHSSSLITLTLRARPDHVHVAVLDNHPELPDPLPTTPDQNFGRGLYLVESLADLWGRYRVTGDWRKRGWKVVWFQLSTGGA
ncbi:ATP-binding protein [Streptomyces sp. NPDC002643]